MADHKPEDVQELIDCCNGLIDEDQAVAVLALGYKRTIGEEEARRRLSAYLSLMLKPLGVPVKETDGSVTEILRDLEIIQAPFDNWKKVADLNKGSV